MAILVRRLGAEAGHRGPAGPLHRAGAPGIFDGIWRAFVHFPDL